jgi:hypothetical protein
MDDIKFSNEELQLIGEALLALKRNHSQMITWIKAEDIDAAGLKVFKAFAAGGDHKLVKVEEAK